MCTRVCPNYYKFENSSPNLSLKFASSAATQRLIEADWLA